MVPVSSVLVACTLRQLSSEVDLSLLSMLKHLRFMTLAWQLMLTRAWHTRDHAGIVLMFTDSCGLSAKALRS